MCTGVGWAMENSFVLGFVAASLVVLVIPGPGVLYVVARSLSQGRRAGLVSVLGLSLGALIQVAAATAGLSAILLTSAFAFDIVKILGACYLIYLGIRALLARQPSAGVGTSTPSSLYRMFVDGVVISVLNPKITVFFLAFLPQFVSPNAGPVPQQILVMGLLYVTLALITDGAYAVLAGGLRRRLGRVMAGPLPRYASGFVYIGLGMSTAFTGRPTALE